MNEVEEMLKDFTPESLCCSNEVFYQGLEIDLKKVSSHLANKSHSMEQTRLMISIMKIGSILESYPKILTQLKAAGN